MWIWLERRVQKTLSFYTPLLYSLTSVFCLTDPTDLMTSHRRDPRIEKVKRREGEKGIERTPKRVAAYSTYIHRSEFSILFLRFIFYFHHLSVPSSVALECHCICNSVLPPSDTAIHFSLSLKIPVPSRAFISNDHSFSLFRLCSFQSGFEKADRHAQ